jgi:aquaporin Z
MNIKKLSAEAIGTAWLVFGGCGSAVLAAAFPDLGIGLMGVSLAFGLTVLTMAFAIGPISGCHLNPAVTIGLAVAGKHPKNEIMPYIAAQVIGGILGAGILYLIATGKPGADIGGFATNGYGEFSPGNFSMMAVLLSEVVCTAFFLFVILGSTSVKASPAFAPISIGLCLTLIHLISIPVSNTSVNPARSLAPALFVGGPALSQVWLFWVAPILGACLGAFVYKFVNEESHVDVTTQTKVHKDSFVARHLRKA